MKKNIYQTILIVVTVFCVIFGTMNHMGFGRRNVSESRSTDQEVNEMQARGFGNAQDAAESGRAEAGKNEKGGAGKNETGTLAETRTDSLVTELRADIDYGSLTVKTGDEYDVRYEGDADMKPEVRLKNGLLTITKKKDNVNFLEGIMHPKAELTVVLPKGTVIDTADVCLDLGDLLITGVSIEEGKAENNLGRIDMNSCRIGNMRLEADMGDVEIEDCRFKDLNIEENLGKVRVVSAQDLSDAGLELETDLGKVLVNGRDQGTNYSSAGPEEIRLTVRNDLGDVEVEY